MRKNKKLDEAVDLEDLAKRTRNFSGAELEGLVRSAQATAMNKLIKVVFVGVGVVTLWIILSPLFPPSPHPCLPTHPLPPRRLKTQ